MTKSVDFTDKSKVTDAPLVKAFKEGLGEMSEALAEGAQVKYQVKVRFERTLLYSEYLYDTDTVLEKVSAYLNMGEGVSITITSALEKPSSED